MTQAPSSAESLRAVAGQWMDLVWQQRQIDAIDRLHAPDFVDHSPSGRATNNAAYKAGIAALYQAFPDWEATTDDLVVDTSTSTVAIRWTATGTHSAPFLGVPATGRSITFVGIEIVRIANGRITERWGEWDALALLEQLGVWQPGA